MAYVSLSDLSSLSGRKTYYGPGSTGATPPANYASQPAYSPPVQQAPPPAQWQAPSMFTANDPRYAQAQTNYRAQQMEQHWTPEQFSQQPTWQSYASQFMSDAPAAAPAAPAGVSKLAIGAAVVGVLGGLMLLARCMSGSSARRMTRNGYTYTLTLTPEDVRTIAFVGGRYSWSNALRGYDAGTHEIPEHEMWDIAMAFDEDTEGGHSMFPMLSERSDLYGKLMKLRESVV